MTPEETLQHWIADEQAVLERLQRGRGSAIAHPEELAGKSGLEVMQQMMGGELPYAECAKSLSFFAIKAAPHVRPTQSDGRHSGRMDRLHPRLGVRLRRSVFTASRPSVLNKWPRHRVSTVPDTENVARARRSSAHMHRGARCVWRGEFVWPRRDHLRRKLHDMPPCGDSCQVVAPTVRSCRIGSGKQDRSSLLRGDRRFGSRNGSMRAVAELTTGAFFFTSALDINARHSRQCVDALCASLRHAQGVDHTAAGNEA